MEDRTIAIQNNTDFDRLYPQTDVRVDGNRVMSAEREVLGHLKAAPEGGARQFEPTPRGRDLIDNEAAGWS